MKKLKDNQTLGVVLSIMGIITGLLAMLILANIYYPNILGKLAGDRPDEAITVRIVFALLAWLGASAGALWVMVLYGFANKAKWAWFYGLLAATVQILSGFFPMIPAASIGLPTPTVWVLVLGFVLWFGMLLIRGVNLQIMALLFVSGMAYVLTFIDGVGGISRYQTEPEGFVHGMYGVSQMVNWWGAIVWVVFIMALAKKKSWALPAGIFAAAMSMFGGYPVGLTDVVAVKQGGFSMFLVAPILSTVLLIYLLLPGTARMINAWVGKE
jgi:hypothetical protein